MKKYIIACSVSFFILMSVLLSIPSTALAQTGYNPEFLGNAAAAPRPGFSPKIFLDYFYREDVSGHDVELAIEPQYWIRGFTGEEQKDYLQFLIHLPIGYRSQDNNTVNEGFGIGMLNANIEHFWKIMEGDDYVWWFDNGISGGFPTATGKTGLRIGGNSYMVTWFQENYIRIGKWVMSISPVSVSYTFKDSETNLTPGLSLNIMNSAFGYQITDSFALGITTSYQLGNMVGTDDNAGGSLDMTHRMYLGPAAAFSFPNDYSLQISIMADVFTRNVTRGQGIALAFWHMF